MILLFTKYYYSDHIKGNEIGGHVAQQGRDKWRALVNMLMNLWVPEISGNIFTGTISDEGRQGSACQCYSLPHIGVCTFQFTALQLIFAGARNVFLLLTDTHYM